MHDARPERFHPWCHPLRRDLLALTAGFFNELPLERMNEAEQALRESAAKIPAEVIERLCTADKLSDEIAKRSVTSSTAFHPKPKVAAEKKP